MATPADQLCKLLNYVVEQSKEIDPHGFKLSTHKGFLRNKQQLAGLPGVAFNREEQGDHVWLRIERLEAQLPPAVTPEAMAELIVVSDNPDGKAPSLNERVLAHRVAANAAGKTPEQLQSEAAVLRASVERALAQYNPLWSAWAAGERPRRVTIDLYGELFSLSHQLESEETAKPQELVWGVGVAAWTVPLADGSGKVDFQYPLLTQTMEIAVEEDLSISVRPRGVDPRLEFDALSACQVLTAPDVERAAMEALDKARDRPVSPFDSGSYDHILRLVSGNLHEKGRYLREQETFPAPEEDLVVTDAWVLMARPRSNNFLHEDIERLKKKISEGVKLPEGALAIVTPPSDEAPDHTPVRFRGLSGTSGGAGAGEGSPVKELFFPLPYNHEQVTIVEQLERSDGVVVQGPPGTGKTHTIANIVCHYLALGRKVLVTSKGEQALEVLQSKIPQEVRPLTVALLSGDREGMRQFQTSIEAILHNVSQLNPEVVRTEIETIQSAIERAHAELASIDRRVDEIALAQLSDIEVDGVPLRAQKMAELVVRGLALHGWFEDVLTLAPEHAPPLSPSETGQLRDARRALGHELNYVGARLPRSQELPAAAAIGQLHDTMVSIRDIESREAAGGLLSLRANTPEVLATARQMLTAVEAAFALALELEETGEVWTAQLRAKCRQAQFEAERKALEALFSEIQELVAARAAFLQRPVEIPDPALGTPKFAEALERAAASGKPFGLLSMPSADVKAHVGAVRVAGLAPAGAEDWKHVQRFAQLHDRVRSFAVRWNQFAETLSVPTVTPSVNALRNIELVTANARKAHVLATTHDAHIPTLAERVFAQPPTQLRGTSSDYAKVREHLRSHLTRAELAQAAVLQATLQEKLAGTQGPISNQFREFVATTLGDKEVSTEAAVARYAHLVAELRRLEGLAHHMQVVSSMTERIEKAGAPKWAEWLRGDWADGADDPALPMQWREAWNWARLKTHLDQIEAREELLTMAARRRDLEAGLARLYISMVEKSAWRSTKLAASAKTLSALESYRTAVRKIGQGTGPNAVRYRRDAQRAMNNAQGAVPCWIMSHSKVSETLPALPGSFHLVIVDEASQSDLWALPAVLRGAKILVVGDDKQVSPEGGFMAATRIQELKDRFLADQYHADMLTPDKSLYDIASSVFAAQKVMLREHFRCVPAIIAYSNRFYNGAMQPLRIPRESERLDPPLVDIFVPSGNRNHRDVNGPEAQAILAEIQAILADKRYAGRSLGVVSLLGPEQAKHIDTLVRSNCDVAELMRRHFKCGDARVFQGSERDIMFLSMVVDPRSSRALSGNMFEQRFNVAASRARDRMYLVRSVELKDLSQADLRAGLLGHFSKPQDGSVDETKSLVELCESGFERDVYTELFGRGYRVIPQVKAGSFFIDMVVEGANDSRLAIELDGDEYHGPDRWQADMNRQRVLERAGWTFWRCFASTWSLHREEVLAELLARLTAMGIEPVGAMEKAPLLVETRVWQPPIKTSGGDSAGQVLEEAVQAAAATVEGAKRAAGAAVAKASKAGA